MKISIKGARALSEEWTILKRLLHRDSSRKKLKYEDSTVQHTWNCVYYDGIWWNMDVTHGISSTAAGKSLYGFRKLDGAFAPDEDFYITNIY